MTACFILYEIMLVKKKIKKKEKFQLRTKTSLINTIGCTGWIDAIRFWQGVFG